MSGELASLRKHWFVACTSSALRKRVVGRMVLGVPIVLFRSGGVAVALVDRCPHRNAALSEGRQVGDLLQCPYHGWAFDDAGECRRIPGLPGDAASPGRRAQTVRVAERDGLVWVLLDRDSEHPPQLPPAQYPPLDHPAFDSFIWVSDARCALVDGLENLLDGLHPHFVHTGLVRHGRRRAVRVTVRRTADMAEVVYAENSAPSGLIPKLLEGMRTASIGRFFPPSTAQLEYLGPDGPRFMLTAMFTPSDEQRVVLHAVVSTPAQRLVPAPIKQALVRLLFGPVLQQDRDVLRRQQANIARFGQPAFTSTPLDVMRPHILYFLRHAAQGGDDPATPYERTLTIEL